MDLTKRESGSITVLEPKGLLVGKLGAVLWATITLCLTQGKKLFVVDLSGITCMDNGSVFKLCQAFADVKEDEGSLVLARISDQARVTLMQLSMERSLPTYKTVEEAIEALACAKV